MILNLHRRIREIDRQYEFNNNGQLDNGVYHKGDETQENGNDEDDIPADQVVQDSPKNNKSDALNLTDEVRAQIRAKKIGSVANSFEDNANDQKIKDRQELARRLNDSSKFREGIENESVELGDDFDLEATAKQFANDFAVSIDQKKVAELSEFGYPQEYIEDSLANFDPNYCTAGYYLIGMDQHYC